MILTWGLLIHYAFPIIFKLLSIFKIWHNADDVFFLLPITLHTVVGITQNMLIPKNWKVYLIARLGKRQVENVNFAGVLQNTMMEYVREHYMSCNLITVAEM